MISTLVLVGLVLVWAVVLLPDLFARVSRGRRSDTIRSFNTQLSSLGSSAPVHRDAPQPLRPRASRSNVIDMRTHRRGSAPGAERAEPSTAAVGAVGDARRVSGAVRKRRQDVLFALGAAALLTLLATVAFGGVFLYVHLLADVLMAAYLVALQRAGAPRPVGSRSAHVAPDLATNLTPLELHRGAGSTTASRSGLQPRRIAN